jgi:RND family efflux transporter MFP subunit
VYKTWCPLLFIILSFELSSGCSRSADSGGTPRKAGRSLVVRMAPVTAQDVVYKVQALGSLEPEELIQITAEVTGAVKEVHFHAGDSVKPDKVLARIDPERYRLEAAKAEAAHRRAVADWKRAESDLARREVLGKENLVAVEELNRARQEAERLAADSAAAKAAWDIALQNSQRAEVRPPRAGEISTRTVDTGQFVQVGNVLATLVDPRRLRLRFKVSESESLKSKEGQTVTFKVASLGESAFTARVYHVGDVADPGTRQVEILAWVDNPGVLKPGFFAEVTLATGLHKGAVVVPESAVQASERGFVVYVVENGKAVERTVKLGLRTGQGAVEIVSGITASETIVIEGSDRLASGVAVEPASEKPAATRSAAP